MVVAVNMVRRGWILEIAGFIDSKDAHLSCFNLYNWNVIKIDDMPLFGSIFSFLVVHKIYLRFDERWCFEGRDDRIDHQVGWGV